METVYDYTQDKKRNKNDVFDNGDLFLLGGTVIVKVKKCEWHEEKTNYIVKILSCLLNALSCFGTYSEFKNKGYFSIFHDKRLT